MTDSPLVTIGISTYNRADSYLVQALDSALGQTYPNLEVVVSDNCSTDGTEALVRSRATARLRYFRQERNIGANNNFNFCLQQAQGQYFLLLHDDDLVDPDFVESCMSALGQARETGALDSQEGEVGVIRTGTRVIDGLGRTRSSSPNACSSLSPADLFLTWFRRDTAFYLCSTLYNTRLLRESGGFYSRNDLYQDVAELARLAVPHGRVDVTAVKASFRRHDNNKGSGDSALAWADDSMYLLELLTRLMPDRADELRREGLPYLCRKCYRIAHVIPNLAERWRTHFILYNRFERSYSPVRFAFRRMQKELRSTAGRRTRYSGSAARPTENA